MDSPDPTSNWRRMRFKRNKVWVSVDDQDRLIVEKGKVLIKYQLDQEHQYRVHPSSLRPLEETAPSPENSRAPDNKPGSDLDTPEPAVSPELLEKAIRIYTDGACSGNPGPAGIGVVMQYGQHRKEISRYVGTATNNIAELEAIKVGLQSVKNKKQKTACGCFYRQQLCNRSAGQRLEGKRKPSFNPTDQGPDGNIPGSQNCKDQRACRAP